MRESGAIQQRFCVRTDPPRNGETVVVVDGTLSEGGEKMNSMGSSDTLIRRIIGRTGTAVMVRTMLAIAGASLATTGCAAEPAAETGEVSGAVRSGG